MRVQSSAQAPSRKRCHQTLSSTARAKSSTLPSSGQSAAGRSAASVCVEGGSTRPTSRHEAPPARPGHPSCSYQRTSPSASSAKTSSFSKERAQSATSPAAETGGGSCASNSASSIHLLTVTSATLVEYASSLTFMTLSCRSSGTPLTTEVRYDVPWMLRKQPEPRSFCVKSTPCSGSSRFELIHQIVSKSGVPTLTVLSGSVRRKFVGDSGSGARSQPTHRCSPKRPAASKKSGMKCP